MSKILIVDDEQDMRSGLQRMLTREFNNIDIFTAESGEKAIQLLENEQIDLALFDIKMPGMNGLELLSHFMGQNPFITVIMMTGYGTIEMAVEAIKLGAYDFISKPFEKDLLYRTVQKGLERSSLLRENYALKQQTGSADFTSEFIGNSQAMQRFLSNLKTIARTNYTTLVRGESGTGKELTAKAIHGLSPRKDKPLIMVNCPAIPEHLLESELFGHVKGAFTGAETDQPGLFAEADGGTICLDEIGDIPTPIQSKLLRVLQEHEVKPLGATKTKKVDVRVIALTNLDLESMIADKNFREDLFYRLNVVTLQTPSLAEMQEDIPTLVQHFAKKVSKELDIELKQFSFKGCQYLARQNWPGNIRELQNCVRRIVMFSEKNIIEPEEIHFIENGKFPQESSYKNGLIYETDSTIIPYKDAKEKAIDEFTHTYVEALLKSTCGNISQAAELSGISRVALQKIIKRHEIDVGEFKQINQ